jgi:hypothetical protein
VRSVTILGVAAALTFLTGASARTTSSATCGVHGRASDDRIYGGRHDTVAPDCEVLYRS